MNQPLLARAHVRHARLRPARHGFTHDTLMLMLPLRSWRGGGAIARNLARPLAFHDRDHGDGGPDALAWLDALLLRERVADAGGEVWLLCFPRVFGLGFKPVSFWFCHSTSGELRAIVAEVNNTFGERHFYLLDQPAWGIELRARKALHVSPFCQVEGGYRFRFLWTPDRQRIVVRIDHDDAHGPLLRTSVACTLAPATAPAARAALLRFALSGAATLARIHVEALRLWLKRVPFFGKTGAPPTSSPPTRQAHP